MEQTSVVSNSAGAGLAVHKYDGALGAELTGVDLATVPGEALTERIKQAFLLHHLICFRGQTLTSDAILGIAEKFGPIEHHLNYRTDGSVIPPIHDVTNLDASGKPSRSPTNNENYYWHTDKSYRACPALLTLLYAVEVPPQGGDTEFADMTGAYLALPDEMKSRIRDLKVVHSWRHMRETISNRKLTQEESREFPDVVHPLVRKHPETGEDSLYLGMYASEVVGLAQAESRALLDSLLAHATQPRFVQAHQWRPGDLIMWDNRCLMHRAVANYELSGHRRVLRRVVVQGGPTTDA